MPADKRNAVRRRTGAYLGDQGQTLVETGTALIRVFFSGRKPERLAEILLVYPFDAAVRCCLSIVSSYQAIPSEWPYFDGGYANVPCQERNIGFEKFNGYGVLLFFCSYVRALTST